MEKSTSNQYLQSEDTGSCQTTTIYSKRTISTGSKDILFRIKQNESFPESNKDIQRTQAVEAHESNTAITLDEPLDNDTQTNNLQLLHLHTPTTTT